MMRKRKNMLIPLICTVLLLVTGCGSTGKNAISEEAKAVCGSWAYIHDRETEVVRFQENGSAKYEDEKYTFNSDGTYITLTDKQQGTQKLRYLVDDEGMYLFKNTIYKFTGEGEPENLIGVWQDETTGWSFQFTEEGTFLEDGYFPGTFTADEKAGIVKLMYSDQFEDTVCYYHVEGNTLYMEYPWRMVHTTKK